MLNFLKGLIYDLVLLLALAGRRKKSDTPKALIIRTDEIGDFILWQSFIPELTQCHLLKGYTVEFVGNTSFRTLFNLQGKKFFSKSVWLHKHAFKTNMYYRFQFLRNIYLERYDIVINPIYSRSKRIDDSIVKVAKARVTIGMFRNKENYAGYENIYDFKLYKQLMPEMDKPVFEFYRNKAFTEFVTATKSLINKPEFSIENIHSDIPSKLFHDYFVVFPGSRSAQRIWPTENFVEVSNYLYEKYKWVAVVCGSGADQPYCKAFIEEYQHPVKNLTNKTTLPDLLLVLKQAKCLLSVDTGSIHLAALVNCTVFGIFNGSQYGRFAPYPKEIANNIIAVYPDIIDDAVAKGNENDLLKYEYVVNIPYASVTVLKMITTIKKYL
ncbi:glycosyltransferase family 9 protein [Hydrotalea sp.]|uniref:glycosyltransferase family 9 protein n=1 Tax=Hydrotalea sp. TaxID=2881279 RepID=UPI00258336D8|nr:glycosyltransferase family 9 protein [Hydrotalea sp.]